MLILLATETRSGGSQQVSVPPVTDRQQCCNSGSEDPGCDPDAKRSFKVLRNVKKQINFLSAPPQIKISAMAAAAASISCYGRPDGANLRLTEVRSRPQHVPAPPASNRAERRPNHTREGRRCGRAPQLIEPHR